MAAQLAQEELALEAPRRAACGRNWPRVHMKAVAQLAGRRHEASGGRGRGRGRRVDQAAVLEPVELERRVA